MIFHGEKSASKPCCIAKVPKRLGKVQRNYFRDNGMCVSTWQYSELYEKHRCRANIENDLDSACVYANDGRILLFEKAAQLRHIFY